jgi:cell division protease FtsH
MYIEQIKIDKDINVRRLAEQTSDFSSAEIKNICNEAALFAARNGRNKVTLSDFQEAMDRVIGGIEKRSRVVSKEERRIIAYHESGHAIVSWFLQYAQPLLKVTIISRGEALGYALYTPKEQYIRKKEEMIDNLCTCLGGRISEEIFFGTQSSGAVNDLGKVCKIAYDIVTIYGMSNKIGTISFYDSYIRQDIFGNKPYSEDTAKMIDEEVRKIVDYCYKRTKSLLQEKKEFVTALAEELLVKETIYKEDIEKIIGKRPFDIEYTENSKISEKDNDLNNNKENDITSNKQNENEVKNNEDNDKKADDNDNNVE